MITLKDAAKRLRLSTVRLRQLVETGRIVGARKLGPIWVMPAKPRIDPPLQTKHRRKK